MNEAQRKAIYEALLGDVSMFPPGDIARRTLEDAAERDVETIEPLIDTMLLEAWKAGAQPAERVS